MLRDIERKVLRILWNYRNGNHGRFPTFSQLSQNTGKHKNEIISILNKLQKLQFIEWNGQDTTSVVIYQGWDESSISKPSQSSSQASDFSRFLS